METVHFGWKDYRKPTPKNIRKAADIIVTITTFAGTYTSVDGHSKIGAAIVIIGFVAKTLSNFFAEIENNVHEEV